MVTFVLKAPKAKLVEVRGQWQKDPIPLTRDKKGTWTVTAGPLPAGVWEYRYRVDDLSLPDPGNTHIKPQRYARTSLLEVPGDPPLTTEFRDVPHGVVHVHHFRSSVSGAHRRLHVYTPPGYPRGGRLPVLYLLHGFTDNDRTWSEHGRAPFVLDNLIAAKRARPMLVVMPDGHPGLDARAAGADAATLLDNTELYAKELLTDVMPMIDRDYGTRRDANSRAIVGLSMGGLQALTVGLGNADRFAWVGGFSAAAPEGDDADALLADPRMLTRRLRWLWIGCGKDDFLYERNLAFLAKLRDRNIPHTWHETAGDHSWPIWQQYFIEIAPQLFQAKKRR